MKITTVFDSTSAHFHFMLYYDQQSVKKEMRQAYLMGILNQNFKINYLDT